MRSHFFAFLSRMRYILRWGLMRNTQTENVAEHSQQVAQLAHGLALIRQDVFGGAVDPNRVAVLALYHDAPEVITGDLPTPVKYNDPLIQQAYRDIESRAAQEMLLMLPVNLRESYRPLLVKDEGDRELWLLVEGADKLAAYLKCVEEVAAGNHEFREAKKSTLAVCRGMHLPEVDYFLEHFTQSFSMSLDEIRRQGDDLDAL